jgi:dihydrofolate reductase
MRKLIYAINLTADGCCDHTKGSGSEDMMTFYNERFRDVDQIVWGRKTYELMVPYWPEVAKENVGPEPELEFARILTALPKVVFSRTLESGEANTVINSGDLREEVMKLKQMPGKAISTGGVDVPEQLIQMGLVDEMHFVILPTIAGAGRRLLADTELQHQLYFDLADTTTLSSGAIALHYVKKGEA